MNKQITRRGFLSGSAGLTFAFAVGGNPDGAAEALAQTSFAPNVWMTIAADGTITIVSPAAEMGQGSFTALPAIIAEELDADWTKVRPVLPAQWEEKKHGNPAYDGQFQTTASSSIKGYFKGLRLAGAQARRVLIDAAAMRWSVPAGELSTEPSVVVHKASGRRMSYGEIAAFAKMPADLPKIEEKDLKSPANFRLIGKDVPRVDVPSKVTGAAQYAIDVQIPDMVYAAVLQSPYPGGAPQAVDDTAARKVPGITDIVLLPEGVGVVGDSVRSNPGRQAPAQGHLVERDGDASRQRTCARRVRRDRTRQKPRRRGVRPGRRRQGRHGECGTRVPRRIPHAIPLSRADGAAQRDRSAQPRRQVGHDLGGHPGADQCAQPGGALAGDRAQQGHASSACAGWRVRPSQPAGGHRRSGASRQSGRQAGEADLEPRG